MIPTKNIPFFLNLVYAGFNRGIDPQGDFVPKNGETFCNRFVQFVANGLGYEEFNGLMANQMFDLMKDPSKGWIEISDNVAQAHANDGVLVIAGWKNADGHGHVNIIIPGIVENSVSANKAVPKCVNVGKDVFIGKRLSLAFAYPSKTPTLFALAGMIS